MGRGSRPTSPSDGGGASSRSLVQVRFTVPVSCFVNLETGRVDRVVVVDEAIKPDGSRIAYSWNGFPVQGRRAKRAWETVEGADWPEWQFGW